MRTKPAELQGRKPVLESELPLHARQQALDSTFGAFDRVRPQMGDPPTLAGLHEQPAPLEALLVMPDFSALMSNELTYENKMRVTSFFFNGSSGIEESNGSVETDTTSSRAQ